MKTLGKQFVVPILVIVVGIGWLLNLQGLIPNVDWIWTCLLGVLGILLLAVGGIDKLTAVIGPFLIVSSICSLLRQTGNLSVEKEVPILILALGILLLAANMLKLPAPVIIAEEEKK